MKKILFLTLVLATSFAYGSDFSVNPDQGEVTFIAKGRPALLKIKGEGAGVKGDLSLKESKISGDIVFSLTSLKTGISLRDTHMKDKYLEVEKYPTAKLSLVDVDVPAEFKGKIKFKGLLKLHGVEKEIAGTVKLKNKASKKIVSVDADFKINLSDFSIAIPSFQGITVAKEVSVHIKTDVNNQVSDTNNLASAKQK